MFWPGGAEGQHIRRVDTQRGLEEAGTAPGRESAGIVPGSRCRRGRRHYLAALLRACGTSVAPSSLELSGS